MLSKPGSLQAQPGFYQLQDWVIAVSKFHIVDGTNGVKPSGFYVYIHRRLDDGLVMHVGKGNRRRAWSGSGRNSYWKNTALKHGVIVEIFRDGMSECCALTLEKIAILHYKNLGHPITNLTYGGGGITGWRHSDETKALISSKGKGRKPTEKQIAALRSNDGKPISEEAKRKMSAAKLGIPRGPMPDSVKEKISRAHMGMKPSAETLVKLRESHLGQKKREENNKFDAMERIFRHAEHGEFIGVQYDLRQKYGLSTTCLSAVVNGNQRSVKGWTYHGTRDKPFEYVYKGGNDGRN